MSCLSTTLTLTITMYMSSHSLSLLLVGTYTYIHLCLKILSTRHFLAMQCTSKTRRHILEPGIIFSTLWTAPTSESAICSTRHPLRKRANSVHHQSRNRTH
ncbi:hypothetical protein V8B97DRAFT_1944335 [Scleroderma yunnanense]